MFCRDTGMEGKTARFVAGIYKTTVSLLVFRTKLLTIKFVEVNP